MHSLGSISAIASEKKIFLYFPIWSCVNTMICGGSHLGFRISIKKPKLFRGPSNDHSWAVWFQLSKWFQRGSVLRHFSHRVQCYIKSCCSRHLPFYIRTKNLNFVEDHPMNFLSSLDSVWFVVSEKKEFEHFPIGSNVNLCPAVVAILDFRSA
jgi:hypothetical protein